MYKKPAKILTTTARHKMNLYLTNPLIKPLEEIAKVILLEISRYGVLTNTLHLYVEKKD
jgi:hypothetical protein